MINEREMLDVLEVEEMEEVVAPGVWLINQYLNIYRVSAAIMSLRQRHPTPARDGSCFYSPRFSFF